MPWICFLKESGPKSQFAAATSPFDITMLGIRPTEGNFVNHCCFASPGITLYCHFSRFCYSAPSHTFHLFVPQPTRDFSWMFPSELKFSVFADSLPFLLFILDMLLQPKKCDMPVTFQQNGCNICTIYLYPNHNMLSLIGGNTIIVSNTARFEKQLKKEKKKWEV